MTTGKAGGVGLLTLGVAMLALGWAFATFPTPTQLLSDHGYGYQLAGAGEILAGRHPFLDFKDTYGPLTHYASAAAQQLAGERVGAELVLGSLSFALGYALLFRLMTSCGVPAGLALGFTCVAITVQPAAFRYPLLLLPMLFLLASWRYAERSNWKELGGVALTVAVAGLFRPDLGGFTFVAGVVLVMSLATEWRAAMPRIIGFAGMVLAGAFPWLAWLAGHGKLLGYLVNSSVDAWASMEGLARSAPAFRLSAGLGEENFKAVLFRFPGVLLAFIAVMLVIRRADLHGPLRARLFCAGTLAMLTWLQGAKIVDWMHVRDTLPTRMLLLAWIASPGMRGRWVIPARVVVAAVGVTLLIASAASHDVRSFSPKAVAEKLRAYGGTRAQVLDDVEAWGENFRAQLYKYVRDHSAPDETIFAVLEAPQINYFAERRLAGPQLAILPGYFSSPSDQQELIARIRAGPTAFVIIDHEGQPEYPGLALAAFAPDFYAFLMRDFEEETRIGYCRVLKPRWRK